MKFTKTFSLITQIALTAGQAFNMFGSFIPPDYRGYVGASLAAFQATLGVVAHYFNPDGTPAETAWTPNPPAKQ